MIKPKPGGLVQSWKQRARGLKADLGAVALALRHPRTPWYTKLLAFAVVAYAISPIDLIPDFVPVLGYLDDLVLFPVGIALVLKSIPPDVLNECRAGMESGTPGPSWLRLLGASAVVALWIAMAVLALGILRRLLDRPR
jgi:uncharacterized membrane protein YkvA (DUF1232 family)